MSDPSKSWLAQLVAGWALRSGTRHLLGGLTHLAGDRLLRWRCLCLRRLVVRLHLDRQLRTRVLESRDVDDDIAALDRDDTERTR